MMSMLYNKRMAYWQTLKAQLNESRGDKRAKKISVSNFLSFNYSSREKGEKRDEKRKKEGGKESESLREQSWEWILRIG